jgi:acetyl esterase
LDVTMPLDPQAQAFLAQAAEAGAPPTEEMTPAEARVAALAYSTLGGEPEEVADLEHRFIPGPSADLPVRIYRPAGAGPEPLPALVYFHGSGWVIINIEVCDTTSRAMANRTGCVVVAVNYQKAPEHKFPIPFDDCYAATRWVSDNAAELGVDPTRLGLVGDSAGGNLAAAVALKARDLGSPAIAYQVLIYPALQYGWDTPSALANAEGYGLQRASMEWFWNHYVRSPTDGIHPYCSPLLAPDHAGLPPALIVTAEFDPLRDDGSMYAEKLEAAGVPVHLHNYEGMIHGFFWMSGIMDQGQALLDEVGKEVRAALG